MPLPNFEQNITRPTNDSEWAREVAEDLSYVQESVEVALEEGLRLGLQFFEDRHSDVDVFLLNSLIRFEAKKVLNTKKNISLEKEDEFEVEDLANIGLACRCNGYFIRIFKSEAGFPPIPNSETKARFYCQQLDLQSSKPNIMYLWELNKNHTFKPLRICCPKYGVKNQSYFEVYFNAEVPSFGMVNNEQPNESETSDIPITLKRDILEEQPK